MTGGAPQSELQPRNSVAVILHLYYPDLWDEMRSYLSHLHMPFDLHVTIPSDASVTDEAIRSAIPNAHIYRCENRGRDILPFLTVFSTISGHGYKYICKIHTKRSAYFCQGDAWRRDMLDKLLGSAQTIERIRTAMDEHPDWGLVAPAGHVLPLMPGSQYWGHDAGLVHKLASRLPSPVDLDHLEFLFVAGSMFWFRPDALTPILATVQPAEFEAEEGQQDGTLAHAFERFFGLVATCGGYRVAESDARGVAPAQIPIQLRLLLQMTQGLVNRVRELEKPQISIQALKDRHAGQTAWIIGKGPSLVMLSKEQIGGGPVIALNEAIIPLESFGLDNPLYSMQKDADEYDEEAMVVTRLGESYIPIKRATLLVHAHESPHRLEHYTPRYVFDNEADFGLEWWQFSSLVAAAVAKVMGCAKVVFVSHDACVFGDTRCCIPREDGSYQILQRESATDDDYEPHRARIDEYLARVGLLAEWLTPEGDHGRRLENDRAMHSENEQLRSQLQRHDDEAALAARRSEALTTELELARAEVESAHSHGHRLREELDLYSRRLEVLAGDLAAARAELESTHNDRQRLTVDLEAAHNDRQRLTVDLEAAHNDRQRLTVDLDASLRHIETLENELQAARHEHDSIERTRAALEADVHAAELDLQTARGDLESRAREQAGLERELQTVRGELEAIRIRLDTTSGELAASRRQIDDLLASKSWRWMAPLRAVNRLLTGDPR